MEADNRLVCVAGKNAVACNALCWLVERFDVSRLVAIPNRDDPGHATWQPSLRQTASRLGVRVASLPDVYPVANLLFVSLEFDQLLRPSRFATRRLFNVHFSLLPAYKGVFTSIWPILNDETRTGTTLHNIDDGIDTGPIVAQREVAICESDTSRDLYFKYMQSGYQLFVEQFGNLVHDRQEPKPQPSHGSSYYSRSSLTFPNSGLVNFRATAHQIRNQVRAFAFAEYQLATAHGWPVSRAEITATRSNGKPGTIIHEDERSLIVNTVDYDVQLVKDYSGALFDAVAANDAMAVSRFSHLTRDINASNRQGWSPLMIACWNAQADVSRVLVDHGADVNQQNQNGTSVLMYAKDGAVRSGDRSLLELLMSRGADSTSRDLTGRTASDYCRLADQLELADYLDNLP